MKKVIAVTLLTVIAAAAAFTVNAVAMASRGEAVEVEAHRIAGQEIDHTATDIVIGQSEEATAAPIQNKSGQAAGGSATIMVSFTVMGVRVVVVDEEGTVQQIWSNTVDDNYLLRVRQGSYNGTPYPATPEVVAQYNQITERIDWDGQGKQQGKVYSR
jgi:hypothetical protein